MPLRDPQPPHERATCPRRRPAAAHRWGLPLVAAWHLAACEDGGARALDATLDVSPPSDASSAPEALPPARDVLSKPDTTDVDAAGGAPVDAAPEASCDTAAITLGSGQDVWQELPCVGARVELVMGPQGGWHVYGRVRMRGVAPDVFLTFSLTPEAGGAPVNLANETVRRMERRGLIRVGDTYESSAGELVILADGVRPPDVVGRRFRFGVRVERPDPQRLRVLVGGDERLVTVVDERP